MKNDPFSKMKNFEKLKFFFFFDFLFPRITKEKMKKFKKKKKKKKKGYVMQLNRKILLELADTYDYSTIFELDLKEYEVNDLIKNCINLEKLTCICNNLQVLSTLSKLKTLHLVQDNLSNTSCILDNISSLTINKCDNLSILSKIFPNLIFLYISNTTTTTTLSIKLIKELWPNIKFYNDQLVSHYCALLDDDTVIKNLNNEIKEEEEINLDHIQSISSLELLKNNPQINILKEKMIQLQNEIK